VRIGIVHPGSMGAAVARVAARAGHSVVWCDRGRSDESRRRADDAGLDACASLGELAERCAIVLSVVPPHGAVAMARAVMDSGFKGLYCDANAIAPGTAREISEIVERRGAAYTDGSLVGPPPENEGDTRLYLSGDRASEIASVFAGTILEPRVLDAGPFAASAIKMCFAAWTKGSSAMLLNTVRLARTLGVDDALIDEWTGSIPELPGRVERLESVIDRKAWRFVGEMDEIAQTFAAQGLPDGFHAAASEVYRSIADEAAERDGKPAP